MSWNRMSLGKKLVSAFMLIAILMAIVGYVGFKKIHQVADADTVLYEKITVPIAQIASMAIDFQQMRSLTLYFIMAKTDEERTVQKAKITDKRKEIGQGLDKFEKTLLTEAGREIFKKLKDNMTRYSTAQEQVFALAAAGKHDEAGAVFKGEAGKIPIEIQDQVDDLFTRKIDIARQTSAENMKTADSASFMMISFVLIGVITSIGLGILISRKIGGALDRVVESLSDGSEQVTSASTQLSGSAQGMAEGASEQAASLEETSSAMEEMSAMTRQNAENAGQAKSLGERAGASVDKANISMNQMVGKMSEISSKGEEIGKIIKTIDEIAFQTNLLALNAAVEAARAGEAGAGFAVVADEVRNLAQRAAASAKSTSELIEGTTRNIKEGTDLVENTNRDFQDVAHAVNKVNELVGEITAASSEQARGITEVSSAISEMDKVTQSNAAGAEEIASSSEELSAQAYSLTEIVRSLQEVVHGEGSNESAGAPGNGWGGRKALGKASLRKSQAEEPIPFDDAGSF